MDSYYGGRGVQEHYWMRSRDNGRPSEVVYHHGSGSGGVMEGEHFFQSIMVMCVVYFVARMFFNGLVGLLILGLSVALIVQLLETATSSVRPSSTASTATASRRDF